MNEPEFFGRDSELRQLHALIDGLPGQGGAILVHGHAGVGKSALLAAAVTHAERCGYTILRTTGIETETHLAYAGLHQLLLPSLRKASQMPAPQRAALEVAFGIAEGPTPNGFLVGLATLELLAEAAAESPVLVVVEDAHVLDAATWEVLPFVARRVAGEPIGMLFAARDGYGRDISGTGLPEMQIESLSPEHSSQLLDSRAPAIAPPVRERLLEQAAGNPLALIELPKSLEALRSGDRAVLPTLLPLTMRLEQTFSARAAQLPGPTQALLLVAAANDGAGIGETLEATGTYEGTAVAAEALAPAERAGLLEIVGEHLRFRHPLMRSAIYQGAGLVRQREAHAALAKVLQSAPDRQVWHRAAACLHKDEAVAVALDQFARRAQAAGALDAAMRALERASELSSDRDSQIRRLLGLGDIAMRVGRSESLQRLERALQGGLTPEQQLGFDAIRAVADESDSNDAARIPPLVQLGVGVSQAWSEGLRLHLSLGRRFASLLGSTAARHDRTDGETRSQPWAIFGPASTFGGGVRRPDQ